jgi:hypothetical protein
LVGVKLDLTHAEGWKEPGGVGTTGLCWLLENLGRP